MPDKDVRQAHYWIYSPGYQSEMWEDYYDKGIMALGWDELGDFSSYQNNKEIQESLMQLYGSQSSYRNIAQAINKFVNEMKIGDVVFAKKGDSKVLGRGIVTGEYEYDADADIGLKSIRQVD